MWRAAAALVMLAVPFGCPAIRSAAATAQSAEAPTLEECAAAIEQASREPDGDRVVLGHLSRKLKMSSELLRAQRAQSGLGWGDVLIANRLSRETLTFGQVVAELKSGKSWEQIARDHNADLAALLADVQQSRRIVEGREEDKAMPSEHLSGPSRGAGRAGGTGRMRR